MQLQYVRPKDIREFVETHDDIVTMTFHEGLDSYAVVTSEPQERGQADIEVRS